MKPWILIDEAFAPDGTRLTLYRRGEELSLRAAGEVLMGSRTQGSEIVLARLAIGACTSKERLKVLVGGLGCGYSLRAALDILPEDASVLVSELVPAVVAWNRSHLAHLAGRPLDDPRVTVKEGDIARLLRDPSSAFDVILLDVDNGPRGLTQESNGRLYSREGLRRLRRTLRPRGIAAVWSAGEDDGFTGRLREAGFEVACHRVRAREGGKGGRHVIWIAENHKSSG